MVVIARTPAIQEKIAAAARLLDRGDADGAERLLAPLAQPGSPLAGHPDILRAMGLVCVARGRPADAAGFLSRSLAAAPRQPELQLHLGKLLAQLGRRDEAIAALRAAAKLKPDLVEAIYELGNLLQQAGRIKEAEDAYRKLLRLAPGHAPAKLSLGALLIDAGRAAEAEVALRRALDEAAEARLKGAVHYNLGFALLRQNKKAEALAHIESAQKLDPQLANIESCRAEILQDLDRHDEAAEVYRAMLARDPLNPALHNFYNDLMYRMGRDDEYLKSYDRAPKTRDLLLGKATALMHHRRAAEAHDVYADMLARDRQDVHAGAGLATTLVLLDRHADAVAAFETVIARHSDPMLLASAAAAHMHHGDPHRALALCEQGLHMAPENQNCLAMMGTALRLMGDERDEILNGYDSLIRVFDLEPPDGFADMKDFNTELCGYLDRVHPRTREYVAQTLRGGTQTSSHLFGAGHDLVDRLAVRIGETVQRYVDELKPDERHPFLSRRQKGFAFCGSWSSRLAPGGFHVNHMHPVGWISSCYYAGVPEAVNDSEHKQGWIKFGQPSFEIGLAMRHAIQPAPGRLVLFPSYVWHGTVPFQDSAPRTTIAFDAVPR